MSTDSLDYYSYPQMLLSFLTESWTDFFDYMSIIEALIMFLAMLVLIAMTGLMLQDKLGKVGFFQETFLWADTSLVLGTPFFTLSSTLIEKELV